jgi:NodT family efflux transporter outer membrane factor (OMF) lipoprotein
MKPTGFRNALLWVSLVPALSGCEVGPDYHPPAAPDVAVSAAPLPASSIKAGGESQSFETGADIAGDWWTLYHSPELDALIRAALAQNPTLAAAQSTLLEAEENYRAGEGVLAPSVSGSVGAQRDQISSAELAGEGVGNAGAITIPPYTLYDASLSVSYSLDLFGHDRRQLEGLRAQVDYQRYELEAAYLTLTANIVTSAVTQASLQAQIDDTRQVIGAETHLLTILQTQLTLGGASMASVLQEQATVASAQATLPPLEAQLAAARDQLADYVGVFPANFQAAAFTLDDLHLPADLPVSLPSAIVAQRPDIAAAAAQLHQATAAVGVADANMLPSISLTGQIGHESLTTGTLFTPQTLLWNLVGGLTQPIFEGGELAAERKADIAALRVAGSQYQATVIAAFQNVADALNALQFDAQTLAAAQASEAAAAKSLAVTQSQYKLGGEPLINVLNAQTTYQNAAIAAVKARAARLSDTAALFQALGGGWWHRNDVAVHCCGLIP